MDSKQLPKHPGHCFHTARALSDMSLRRIRAAQRSRESRTNLHAGSLSASFSVTIVAIHTVTPRSAHTQHIHKARMCMHTRSPCVLVHVHTYAGAHRCPHDLCAHVYMQHSTPKGAHLVCAQEHVYTNMCALAHAVSCICDTHAYTDHARGTITCTHILPHIHTLVYTHTPS